MVEANDDKARGGGSAAIDGVHDAANKTADAAREVVGKASDSASQAMGSVDSAVTDAVDATQQNVSAGLRQATEVAGDIGDKAITIVKRHPTRTVLLVAACAIIAGFIAGVVIAKRG